MRKSHVLFLEILSLRCQQDRQTDMLKTQLDVEDGLELRGDG